MFQFHENLYSDVRIEDVYETRIVYTLGSLDEMKTRRYKAAFVRVYDGERWYYAATSDVERIQEEIDKLSVMAKPNPKIYENDIVDKFQSNQGEFFVFTDNSVRNVDKYKKAQLLEEFFPVLSENGKLKVWKTFYADSNKQFYFYSSKGAALSYDVQRAGFSVNLSFSDGDKKLSENFPYGSNNFEQLLGKKGELKAYIKRCEEFLQAAKTVVPGKYEVILSPLAAGIFAHESFGHKSEADFMVGDEMMKKEWAIGTKVDSDILSIVDSGLEPGSGYVPFDDEGTKAARTFLVKDGVLAGRLHSASTAASLDEKVTGNARSVNYEFEPIVRMTTTYILPGELTKDQLFAGVKDGYFIDTVKHGSGMSTFTIAPSLAYRIQDGKITEPVNISVISGTVFETLSEINGLSNELELMSFITGGCGKMEQYPLPVGFGGPYVRITNMNVQ